MISLTDENAQRVSQQIANSCDAIERLIHDLQDSKGRVAEEVHAIRKLGKSLRGGFSLCRLGESAGREIQVIGRLLSEPRDAVSRLNTWQKLDWQSDAPAAAAIAGLLDQQTHSAARRPPPETIAWCIARVTAARENLLALPPTDLAEEISLGLKKLQKQVKGRCKELDHNGQENFHDARKALKAYLGAIQFLPEGTISLAPQMVELPEILGDENDLATLADWLEGHGFSKKFVPLLWKKLKTARTSLRKQAIQQAALLVSTKVS